jgi:hypothetical protein
MYLGKSFESLDQLATYHRIFERVGLQVFFKKTPLMAHKNTAELASLTTFRICSRLDAKASS